jgi:integrase
MSASTQSQALNTLAFHFKNVLGESFGELGDFRKSKRPKKLPVVLSREEVRRLLDTLDEPHRLPVEQAGPRGAQSRGRVGGRNSGSAAPSISPWIVHRDDWGDIDGF